MDPKLKGRLPVGPPPVWEGRPKHLLSLCAFLALAHTRHLPRSFYCAIKLYAVPPLSSRATLAVLPIINKTLKPGVSQNATAYRI